MKVEMLATDRLIPYARNPRKNDGAVDAVAASIREFGFRQPIVVDEQMTVLVGHTRLKAAIKLGLQQVPVHIATGLTDAQKKAYRIADNKTGELAEWDNELLSLELEDLRMMDFDLDTLAFDEDELNDLLADKGTEGLVDADDVPEVKEDAISKPGDIWLLGNHRIMCGDSTKAEDVARLMKGEKADAVLTDPPYGISYSPGSGGGGILRKDGSRYKKSFSGKDIVIGDNISFDPSHVLSIGVPSILWGGNHYASRLPDSSCWLVWDKRRGTSVNDFADCEIAWTNLDSVARVFAHMWNGMLKDSEKGDVRLHPTQKPVELMVWCIEKLPGELLYEPFSGSGTTIIAAEKTGRRCYAMEIAPNYVDVAVKRWQQFTGKQATLEATGAPFPTL